MIDRIEIDGTVIIEPGYFEGYNAHLLTRDDVNPAYDELVVNVWHDSWPANTYASHVVAVENGAVIGSSTAVIAVIAGDGRQSVLASLVAEHFLAHGLTLS